MIADGKTPVTSELFHTCSILRASGDLRAVSAWSVTDQRGTGQSIYNVCLPVWCKLPHARSYTRVSLELTLNKARIVLAVGVDVDCTTTIVEPIIV